jgi:hypothetical protein
MCQLGYDFASSYEVKASGYMTGPEGAVLYNIGTSPILATSSGDVLSCGEWEKYTSSRPYKCIRPKGSTAETAQWSYTTYGYGEQADVDDLKVTLTAWVNDQDYRTKDPEATYVVSCPSVDYCTN